MRSSSRRIVCVDDSEDTCEMLRALLGQLGYEIETRQSYADTLRTASDGATDLYIIDSRLPDGSGYDLCRQLHRLAPGTPVIFYSGAATQSERAEGLAAGAHAYVTKPTVDELLATVTRLLPVEHAD